MNLLIKATLALGLLATSSVAAAQYGSGNPVRVRWSTPVYAGPSTGYPTVAYLGAGGTVRLNGCLSDYAWCDVTDGANRGWVDADKLAVYRGNTPYSFNDANGWFTYPIVTFYLNDYWRRHYPSRSWYHQSQRYDRWDWRHDNRGWNRPDRPSRPGWDDRNRNGNDRWRDRDRDRRDGRDHRNDRRDRPGWDNRDRPASPEARPAQPNPRGGSWKEWRDNGGQHQQTR